MKPIVRIKNPVLRFFLETIMLSVIIGATVGILAGIGMLNPSCANTYTTFPDWEGLQFLATLLLSGMKGLGYLRAALMILYLLYVGTKALGNKFFNPQKSKQ